MYEFPILVIFSPRASQSEPSLKSPLLFFVLAGSDFLLLSMTRERGPRPKNNPHLDKGWFFELMLARAIPVYPFRLGMHGMLARLPGPVRDLRLLGEGGMGRVYLARQIDLGRQVVVKVMHDHIAADPKFRDRFQRETLLMARFQHPYAVTLYDASLNDPHGPCIVMEYIRASTSTRCCQRNSRLDRRRASAGCSASSARCSRPPTTRASSTAT